MLRFRVRVRPRKMSSLEGLGSGPEGRLKRLRKHVTALIRDERIETSYAQCDETRGYAEKLIHMAVRHGDTHPHTMEMADYWLLEKELVHKLFKVLVPRYTSFPASFTAIHRLSPTYPGTGTAEGVLELKGNPWPSVKPKARDTRLQLHNVLLNAAKLEHHKQHHQRHHSTASTTAPHPGIPAEGSSVDGLPGSSVDADSSGEKTVGGER